MCLRKFCALFAAVVLCSFAFVPLDVVAYDATNSKTLTASEAADLFGDTLTVKYFNGTEYVEQFATLASNTVRAVGLDPSMTDYDTEVFDFNTNWLHYVMQSGANTNPSYISVEFSPTTTFKNTEFLVSAIAVCNSFYGNGGPISNTYSSSTADVFVDGQKQQLLSSDNGDVIQAVKFSNSSYSYTSTVIPINLSFSKNSTVVLDRCCFYGTAGIDIYLRIPTVSLDAVAESGDTSGSGSGSGGSVDLGETNGLLGTIVGWLQGVFDAITGLPAKIAGIFLPDDTFLDDWRGTVSALWSDHFGAFIIATDTITDIFSGLTDTTARTSIDFPVVTVPLAGTLWTFGGWSVPLKPTGFDALYTALALAIDLICTIAFVNMLHRKYEKLVSGGVEGAD